MSASKMLSIAQAILIGLGVPPPVATLGHFKELTPNPRKRGSGRTSERERNPAGTKLARLAYAGTLTVRHGTVVPMKPTKRMLRRARNTF